jgi:two-component system response regulator VicR
VGVLCALDQTNGEVSEDTVAALTAFSEVAGNILGRVQVYSKAEKRSSQVVASLQQSIDATERIRGQGKKRVLRFGALVIDPARETVRAQESQARLTRTEFDLLYTLAENSGSLINQETLLREVWGKDFVPQGKVVDVTIHRLRRKLANIPDGKELISTVRGQGYLFRPPKRYVTSP